MTLDNIKHSDLTSKTIRAFYNVYNTLDYGFLEKVYENVLFIELTSMGLIVEKLKKITVYYQKIKVGEYSLT